MRHNQFKCILDLSKDIFSLPSHVLEHEVESFTAPAVKHTPMSCCLHLDSYIHYGISEPKPPLSSLNVSASTESAASEQRQWS